MPSICRPTLRVALTISRNPSWSCFTEDALRSIWHSTFEISFYPWWTNPPVLWAKRPRIGSREPLVQTKGWGWVYTLGSPLFWTDNTQTNTQAFRNFLNTCGYCADSLIENYFRNNKGTSDERWLSLAATFIKLHICTNTLTKCCFKARNTERSPR